LANFLLFCQAVKCAMPKTRAIVPGNDRFQSREINEPRNTKNTSKQTWNNTDCFGENFLASNLTITFVSNFIKFLNLTVLLISCRKEKIQNPKKTREAHEGNWIPNTMSARGAIVRGVATFFLIQVLPLLLPALCLLLCLLSIGQLQRFCE